MKKYNIFQIGLFSICLSFFSCSLDEFNPGAFNPETLSTSIEGYETLVNQSYFAAERYFYGTENFMSYTEGNSDLWTNKANIKTDRTEWFWFYGGTSPNTEFTNNLWNGVYDGIGSCNIAIGLVANPPYKSEEERNAKLAEAKFMRAIYYFNAVEMFGAVTKITEPGQNINFMPEKTDPLTIYKEVIIPDLQFAAEWLPKGTHETTTRPTKKSTLGFLAKACLQTVEYDTREFLELALKTAKDLIIDSESGGVKYNAFMYPDYFDVFNEENNWNNKEALWKHRWVSGTTGHGSSNGNYKLNRNDEYFLCDINRFGAREDNQETRITWEGSTVGYFMPTQHLLSLYRQDDGALDPRFNASFTRSWKANVDYTWDSSGVSLYNKDKAKVEGKKITKGNLAIKFIMPEDENYLENKANQNSSIHLVVDYFDVYSDEDKNVKMQNSEGKENLFRYFYPSLNKHNSSNYFVADGSKRRNGNLNATFMMRMSEIYLIAAEVELLLNNDSEKARNYINKVRNRAKAKPLTTEVTIQTILDERGRELCGEYCRFYDLKRTGMFKNQNYLKQTHPDLAIYFRSEYALKPIPEGFISGIENGSDYQNPGY